jgi:phage terminase small subunit
MAGRPGMATGRPVPTAIKRLESPDGRHDRSGRLIRTDEIQPEPAPVRAEPPKPPKELSRRAKRTWIFIHQSLAQSGLITPLDDLQLTVYCALHAKFLDLLADGKFMSAAEIGQMRALSASFGFDPSSRARPTFPGVRPSLSEPSEDDGDALAQLRQRKRGTA